MSEQGKRRWRVSRRGFLIGLGIVGGGLAVGVPLGLPRVHLAIADALESGGGPPSSITGDPLLWFAIAPDGAVTMAMPKVEMGQGIHSALAQIAAEELGVEWGQISVRQSGSLGPVSDAGGTSASNSVVSLFTPLRQAAATMREMLRGAAAARLGVPAADLAVAVGAVFVAADPSRRLGFGELAAGQAEWEVPEEPPPLKPAAEYQLIGQPLPRLDLPPKVVGAAVYGYDARAEGMRYGAVARPPTLGARLLRADPGEAAAQPGVIAVVVEPGFAGVVADSRAAAFGALGKLVLEWEQPAPLQQEQIEALVRAAPGAGVVVQERGDTGGPLARAGVVSAEYRTPMAAHASMEPQAALVDVRPERVVAQVSTQSPGLVAGEIARALGRDEQTVEVTPTYLGGGFGRKLNVEVAIEAARLSAAASVPVHVGWTRTEEFREGYLRPPTHHVLRAALGADGRIDAIEHAQASGDVLFGFFPAPLKLLFGADLGAWRGGRISYDVPNISMRALPVDLPLRTGAWRGLGLLANVFAVESFIDELAHSAGADPLEFRLRHLGADELGGRMRAALASAAARGGWGTPVPQGRARGIACCVDARTVAAHVVEVSVGAGEGGRTIRVHKVWAAVDPGLPINPDGARAQTEGNITMGLSAALLERATVKDGKVEAGNFDRYPLLSMRDAPEIDVAIIRSGDEPFGMGEPPMGPIAAAVANAVFALTGERLRELPLKLG
jgi:isoquinoline 1-oxidoreductase beta subunit